MPATRDGKPLWQDYLPEAFAANLPLRGPEPGLIDASGLKAAKSLNDDIGGIVRARIDTAMEEKPNAPSSEA